MKNAFIIAEIGSNLFKYKNPGRCLQLAFEQIEAAKAAGADAVKFQLFTPEELWGPSCKDLVFAELQSVYSLPYKWVPELRKHCKRHKIEFLCSGFSLDGFKYLDSHVKKHKIASPEVWDEDTCDWLFFQNKKPKIISLGCCKREDIETVFRRMGAEDVALECVSEYPAQPYDYNLFDIQFFSRKYTRKNWGISDHTDGVELAKFARAAGASYFEKHVDFFPGEGASTPDSGVSCTGMLFKTYVDAIRKIEPRDYDTKKRLAKKLYARRNLGEGWYRPYPEGAPGAD